MDGLHVRLNEYMEGVIGSLIYLIRSFIFIYL